MTIQTYWQIDVAEDATRSEARLRPPPERTAFRDVRTPVQNRYDYYAQVAQAAAQTAFDGVFLPNQPEADDSGIVAAAIAREVPRIALLAEFPAWGGSAVYAAKRAATFQRATGDRLGWAIAAPEAAGVGAGGALDAEEGHSQVEELLHVARGVHGQSPFSFAGRYFQVQDGGLGAPLNRSAFPRVFLQGESEQALALSARSADVHLFAAAPLDVLRDRIVRLETLAVGEGRSVTVGIRQPLLARDTAEEAARDAERAGLDAIAIVGSFDEAADRLAELAGLGIRHFVLGAPSSLEEAYRIGQRLLPGFRARTEPPAIAA